VQFVWKLKPFNRLLRDKIAAELRISSVLATLLVNRGAEDPESARRFLDPQLEHLHSPFQLVDCDRAVERILVALDAGQPIAVLGDQDTDGVAATALTVRTLTDLGGKVSYYIPDRMKEGFGLGKTSIEMLAQRGAKLIVTVDSGMSNHDEVSYAKKLGVDVIITDHHQPLGSLPSALAVVNPLRDDCPYPFKGLTGVGIAYKLSQAIAMRKLDISASQWYGVTEDLLALLLVGTLADRAPLIEENRVFARYGIHALMRTFQPWAKTVSKVTGAGLDHRSSSSLFSSIIPLLSAGRSKGGANPACELLLTDETDQAEQLAYELFEASRDWYERAKGAYDRLQARQQEDPSLKVIITIDERVPVDVLGYCANRLKERFLRPAVVIGFAGDRAIGEIRAPSEPGLLDFLKDCDDLLLDYGGHKAAAGFSLERQNIGEFAARLTQYAERWDHGTSPTLEIDKELSQADLNPEMIQQLRTLAPFGEGNPEPLFLTRDVYVAKQDGGYRILGSNLLLEERRPGLPWPYPLDEPVKVDIVYLVDESGRLLLKDFRATERHCSP